MNNSNQEIDLIYLFKKIKDFVNQIGLFIYLSISFLKKNIIYILVLVLLGYGLGIFLEKKVFSTIRSEVMVIPNFDSTTFLYNEIDVLNQTIKKYPELNGLVSISIEPIVDFNDLINHQEGDLKKVYLENEEDFKEDNKTLYTFYKSHLLVFRTLNVENTDKIVDYILKKINTNQYFLEKKRNEQIILEEKEKQIEVSINQINNILNKLGSNTELLKDDKSVNVNTYSELSGILKQKNELIKDLSKVKDNIITSKEIIYPFDKSVNISKTKISQNSYKYTLPLIFIGCFLLVKFYLFLDRKYKK